MGSLFPICPKCESPIEYKHVDFKNPFGCPVCQTELRIPHSYSVRLALSSVLLTALLFFALGFRSYKFVVAVLLLWFPVHFLLFGIVRHLIPPRVEPLRPEFRELQPK
jgi:uncharacterized paraquat-inducible protein A